MDIKIKGAREHNLKNISLTIPRNKITTFVGLSGSGKSTIAHDIIYAEGQRQFLESVSTFAARLMKRTQRPDVDEITGLSPTILIDQGKIGVSTRSTVGTSTEIYTYLRLLFSRAGSKKLGAGYFSFNNPKGACKSCKGLGFEVDVDLELLVDFEKALNESAIKNSAYKPGGRYLNILKTTKKVDFDTPIKNLSKEEADFIFHSPQVKLKNAEQGFVQSYSWEGIVPHLISRTKDLRGISEAKEKQDGGYRVMKTCSACGGSRLNENALSSEINNQNIGFYSNMQLSDLVNEVAKIDVSHVKPIVEKIVSSTQALVDIGMGYLSLNRSLDTLSGGEAQRIKLARELGSDLIEVIYVMDEPTAGLHPKDVDKLLGIIKRIRDSQNTVVVVEHDAEVMKNSDYLIEIGPGAGKLGGNIVAKGTPEELIKNPESLTGKYLNKPTSQLKTAFRKSTGSLSLTNVNLHNLKNVSVDIPTGVFTAVTGVSGSGKSSLIIDVFAKKYADKVVLVDQSPLGGSPRGNAATYVGAFDLIRGLLAKENKVSKSLFSFNGEGACPDCKGLGYNKIDMHFMADVKVVCETCNGKRYLPEVFKYKYKGEDIGEILDLTISEAYDFFDEKEIRKRLEVLNGVGLGYVTLGQTHDTFSGGEAQRLKLADKLHNKGEFYILDEPTSGLHFADIERLLVLLNKLVDAGNSVLVIEHNTDVINQADWIIELGPGGGDKGGEVVANGARSVTF